MDWDVVVVGAGAAGLLAAAVAAERGKRTLLLEKNNKAGVKILISGGTRCNITHDTDRRGIIDAYGRQGRFLHSALAALGPQELVAIFEAEGVGTKVEETGKVFPISDRAIDVRDALLARLRRSNCTLALGEPLTELTPAENGFQLLTSHRKCTAAKVIVTTGGQSYPGCGTTGDGYAWARKLGHTIVPPRPALVPITSNAAWVLELKGVTIPDVLLRVLEPGRDDGGKLMSKCLNTRRGSLLFTHFGFSGPVALDISREISGHPLPHSLLLSCDFLPDLRDAECDESLRQQAAIAGKRQLFGIFPEAIPRRLADVLLSQAGVSGEQKASQLSKADRGRIVQSLKHLLFPVSGTRGFSKAEVTAGGVSLDEVDSRTLQSKRVPGLYFAGEVLDLDGPIGGFNFQAAFSTGWLAGQSV